MGNTELIYTVICINSVTHRRWNYEWIYNISIGGNTPRFKRKNLSISDLVDLYVNKEFTLEEIASKYEVSRYIINSELKNAGIIIRDRHESSSRFNKISKSILLNAINNSKSIREAAKYANIPYSTFRKACIYNHIEYNSSTSAQHTNKYENVCWTYTMVKCKN